MSTFLVTGGCGFIGSALCRRLLAEGHRVVNLDKLTYASSPDTLRDIEGVAGYRFVQGDIADRSLVAATLRDHAVDAVVHLAAESHVDRSIDGPQAFVETNIVGTFHLLEAALDYWRSMEDTQRQAAFRFHHVSTDEVFGDLPFDTSRFVETTPYAPSSPYSATKAASDHLVHAWHRTFGLPTVLSNCSNNYGPFQFPEKLIPLVTLNAVDGRPLPVYGEGSNVRDWLHVDDHAEALHAILTRGRIGESYNVGGDSERTNLDVVHAICDALDAARPRADDSSHRSLIQFVADRPGHDRRYAIDCAKIRDELGWTPRHHFDDGLAETVRWYLENDWWWTPIREGRYAGARLGGG